MTAEQFWLQWRKVNNESVATKCLSEISCEFAESYAAAQLAEKERLQNETYDAFSKADDERERQWRRAEAAEERLKEAQARWELYEREYILPQFGWAEELGIDLKQLVHDNAGKNCAQLLYEALRERLRQREAELEQRWIAVGERMPEQGQIVLIAVTPTSDKLVAMFKGERFISQPGMWAYDPTHWQPLPSPPKVQP